MPAPSVLPGRANQRINRVSQLLFHWRAADLSLTPITGQAPTFVRATAGGRIPDVNGRVRDFAQYEPRFQMVDLDGDGVRESPMLLVERAATNSALYFEDFSQWSTSGTPTLLSGAHVASGVSMALLGDDSAGAVEFFFRDYAVGVLFGGGANGQYPVSICVKRATPSATGALLAIVDTTASVDRLEAVIDFTAGGVPIITMRDGTFLGYEPAFADGVYRLWFRTTSGTNPSNAHSVRFYPAGAGAVSETGTIYAGGVQVENAIGGPTSMIYTAGSAVVRNADALYYEFLTPPRGMTVYVRRRELGTIYQANGARVLQIGKAAATESECLIYWNGTRYAGYHHNSAGGEVVSNDTIAAPSLFDLVEHRMIFGADGSVRLGQALNGGAEVLSTVTAALALDAAWGFQRLYFGGSDIASIEGLSGFLDVKVSAVVDASMAQMRQAF